VIPTASETFTVADSQELAVLTRSGFVESRHVGSAVVLDGASGHIITSLGDPLAPVFPRSAMKPFQAVAMLTSGAPLSGEFVALSTASHTGSAEHVRLVTTLLGEHGLTQDQLACPVDMPSDRDMVTEITRGFGEPERRYMNCSGKHAAMLVTCVVNGWPIEGYLDPGHPLQKVILETVEEFIGEPVSAAGIDGCGAPVFAMSLVALARGIRRVGTARHDADDERDRAAAQLRDAVIAHPYITGGAGEHDTAIVSQLGVFAKRGAEGVMVVSAHDGTTVALKVLDGNLRAAGLVAVRLLENAGVVDAQDAVRVREHFHTTVLGGGLPVGELRTTV
jgi:L-asparaginase II